MFVIVTDEIIVWNSPRDFGKLSHRRGAQKGSDEELAGGLEELHIDDWLI